MNSRARMKTKPNDDPAYGGRSAAASVSVVFCIRKIVILSRKPHRGWI